MKTGAGTTVASHHVCRLGEGPTYDPVSKRLFWFDIVGRRLLEKAWPDGETLVHELPEMGSALAFVDDDTQLVLTETGLWLRNAVSGRLSKHLDIEADNKVTRSNDARVHPCGAFWLGTMGKDGETGAGSIYWHFRGELRRLYDGITTTNSICFSPDGATAYFTDTRVGMLNKVACDPDTGLPRGEPEVFADGRSGGGRPDGSVVDAEGNLWNARWGSGEVACYGPDGSLKLTVPVPASRSSCPAFVGKGGGRLVVTSAWNGMSDEERAAEPDAGKLFLLDVEVRGRFEPRAVL